MENAKCLKEFKRVAFWGDMGNLYARFAVALACRKRKILVYDASVSQRLMVATFGVYGKLAGYRFYHNASYTSDLTYVMEHYDEYELVIMYDDLVNQDNFRQYSGIVDTAIVVYHNERYSVIQTTEIIRNIRKSHIKDVFFINMDVGEEGTKKKVQSSIDYVSSYIKSKERRFCVPLQKEDVEAFNELEFGRLCLSDLSDGFRRMILMITGNMGVSVGSRESAVALYGV